MPAFEEYEFQFVVGTAGTDVSCEKSNRDIICSWAQHAVYGEYSHPMDSESVIC